MMPVSPGFKRLWLMMATAIVLIASVVYLVVVPIVDHHPLSLTAMEERLLSESLLPPGEISQGAVSGGMSRGGSFSRPSSPAPSAPRSFSPSSGSYGYRSAPGPVIVPYPTYAPAPVYVDTGDGGGGLLIVLVVLGFILLPIALHYLQGGTRNGDAPAAAGSQSELLNDIVTVTRLQVALLSGARELQHELDTIVLRADLNTSAGLTAQLRETVLALLRHPDYWTHVRAESQTVAGREKAAALFERLSIEERSKFMVETLINVGGEVQRRAMPSVPSGDVAAYIVVTLLLGTADDRPLFKAVNSAADLRAVLQRLGALSPAYLLVYELLWSPQDETDSLSEDDLVANYPDLVTL